MKNTAIIKRFAVYATILISNATPAWAATNREDNSDLFVWIFLAFCALIVIAQLIPAAMVLFGAFKGVHKETAEVAPEVALEVVPDVVPEVAATPPE